MKRYVFELWKSDNIAATLLRKRVNTKRKLVVEYSSPNIAKQFHVGNLRSTLIGRFIDRINRVAGHTVTSINYLGDWGSQFALLTTHWPHLQPSNEEWNLMSDSAKIKRLAHCYIDANKLAKSNESFRAKARDTLVEMEQALLSGDKHSAHLGFWRNARELTLTHLNQFYKVLDVQFDETFFESDLVAPAHNLIERMVQQGIAHIDASGLTFTHAETHNERLVLKKSDQTSLYLSRDLASALLRTELFDADEYMYVVDHSQAHHFHNLKKLLCAIHREDVAAKIKQVPFGRVRGLSTRKGSTEAVTDIVERACELAASFIAQSKTVKVATNEVADVARKLSYASIIVDDLKRARSSEFSFTFANAFRMNQSNAILLEMKHSRLCSIEHRHAELMLHLDHLSADELKFEFGDEPCTQRLLELLQLFPDVLLQAYETLEPCRVTIFLMQLANAIGSATAILRVSGQRHAVALPRLLLLSTTRKVLGQGMQLLGVEPLSRM